MKKMNVVCVVGPTAAGKTGLSLDIAEAVGGEIVSADSRQVYRGLDIGSGKIMPEEMRGIPHHLLDVADARETFTAADYGRVGREALADIHARGTVPIVVGGSGFYIDVLFGRIPVADVPPDQTVRKRLSEESVEKLQEMLKQLDPERYETVDIRNPRRLIRAIEVARARGLPARASVPQNTTIYRSVYDVLWIGLSLPLNLLREKIKTRLFVRLDSGMLKEARRLHEDGLSYERMEELGLEYRSMARHLQGFITYEDMVAELESEIGRYAKRQMTWFRRNKKVQWFEPNEKEKILKLVQGFKK